MLLDEPLGALDKQLREEMQLELRDIHRSLGVTMIFVTHDQSEALTMSDRIAVFNRGRIEQLGSPRDVYDHPRTRFVAEFIGETNVIEAKMTGHRDGIAEVMAKGGHRLQVCSSEAVATGRDVLVCVRPERLDIGEDGTVPNALPATVVDTVYQGDHIRMKLQAEGLQLVGRRERRLSEVAPHSRTYASFRTGPMRADGRVMGGTLASRMRAAALVAPLAIFLAVFFVWPLVMMLRTAVVDDEVARAFPTAAEALAGWDGTVPPSAEIQSAVAADLRTIEDRSVLGDAVRRLNSAMSGFRSLMSKTYRAVREGDASASGTGPVDLVAIDGRWGDARDVAGAGAGDAALYRPLSAGFGRPPTATARAPSCRAAARPRRTGSSWSAPSSSRRR